ncbi:MAG: hypothetical protein V3W41_17165 [Planctomycetota bacterium]
MARKKPQASACKTTNPVEILENLGSISELSELDGAQSFSEAPISTRACF